jgi:Signal transduction histidine kinase
MKLIFSSMTGLFLFFIAFSQKNNYADSLKQVLLTTQDDTIKGLTIATLSQEYLWKSPFTSLYYTNMGLELIKKPSVKTKFAISNNPTLYSFDILMYENVALASAQQRNDSLAINMIFRALHLAEKSKDKYDVPRVYGGVGLVYSAIGEHKLAIEYYKKRATSYDPLLDEYNRHFFLASIGQSYYELGNADSALAYINKVYSFFHLPENNDYALPDFYLGKIYNKRGDFHLALSYYKKSMKIARDANLISDLSDPYLGISETYKNLGQIDSSVHYAREALGIAVYSLLPNQSLNATTALASLFESERQFDSAYKYQKMSTGLKDSLFNKEKIKQVQNFMFSEQLLQQEIMDKQKTYENKIKIYSLKEKRTPEGYKPIVSLITKKADMNVEMAVRDNGNGIPNKVVNKIFQPFFTTKPTGQGTGLGLSLAYDIVKAHGGEIKVETKEGEYTEFIIHLPFINN